MEPEREREGEMNTIHTYIHTDIYTYIHTYIYYTYKYAIYMYAFNHSLVGYKLTIPFSTVGVFNRKRFHIETYNSKHKINKNKNWYIVL